MNYLNLNSAAQSARFSDLKFSVVGVILTGLAWMMSFNMHAYAHGGWGGGGHWGHGYYGPGVYPGWGGPNVIINVPLVPSVPVVPYYPQDCETVEICDRYAHQCWLERDCR